MNKETPELSQGLYYLFILAAGHTHLYEGIYETLFETDSDQRVWVHPL